MPTPFNDNAAWLTSGGALTLGGVGTDDGAGNTTYKYAKNDTEYPIIASELIGDTLPALTFDGSRTTVPMRTLAASTTHKVIIPFHPVLRTYSTYGHGTLINSVSLFYRVNTTTLTSATMALEYETLAAAASLAAATAPAGAVTGNTLTAAANVYEMIFTPTTPAWYTTTGTIPYVLATIVTPGSSTCDLFGAVWRCASALY